MMDTLCQLARYLIAILLMPPLLGGALLVGVFSNNASIAMVQTWNRAVLWLFGITFEVQYQDGPGQLDKGGIIVGLNQQSLIDPTVGFAAWDLPVKAIYNIEYALIPLLGWVSLVLGWVVVRQNPKQSRRQIDKASQHAARGGLVFLSAEGKRSEDGSLNPYKKGPVVMAIKAQCLIHPVYIANSRPCLPPGSWKIRPGHIVVKYLPPIDARGMTYADRDRLLKQLEAMGAAEHQRWQ